jgi:hypothetical protein
MWYTKKYEKNSLNGSIKNLNFFMPVDLFLSFLFLLSLTPYQGVCRQKGTEVGQNRHRQQIK